MKDHRFNRLSECFLTLLHHLYDIGSYLEKFTNAVNGILISYRVCRHGSTEANISSSGITWRSYLEAWFSSAYGLGDKLYNIAKGIPCCCTQNWRKYHPLSIKSENCFNSVSADVFKRAFPSQVILDELIGCCEQYPEEIEQILFLNLKNFAYGFSYQKRSYFWNRKYNK